MLKSKGFSPRLVPIREITPRLTKHGTIARTNLRKYGSDLSMFTAGAPFTEVEWVEFNPSSPKEIVKHLNEVGWKPVDKTKGHLLAEKERNLEKLKKYKETGYKVNEQNLSTLPYYEDMDLWRENCRIKIKLKDKNTEEIIIKLIKKRKTRVKRTLQSQSRSFKS